MNASVPLNMCVDTWVANYEKSRTPHPPAARHTVGLLRWPTRSMISNASIEAPSARPRGNTNTNTNTKYTCDTGQTRNKKGARAEAPATAPADRREGGVHASRGSQLGALLTCCGHLDACLLAGGGDASSFVLARCGIANTSCRGAARISASCRNVTIRSRHHRWHARHSYRRNCTQLRAVM
jgi:hypothetical protein